VIKAQLNLFYGKNDKECLARKDSHYEYIEIDYLYQE